MEVLRNLFKDLDKEYWWSHISRRTVVIGGLLVGLYWFYKKPRGLPPGPSLTLPIFGDLLSIFKKSDGSDIRVTFRRMRKQYGDIFRVYMGPRLFIILNGFPVVKDALVKNADTFSERPSLYLFERISLGKGISFTNGKLWKEQRKFTLETLREFGFGRTIMEDKIHEEIEIMLVYLQNQNGLPFDMRPLIQASVANVICNVTFGQRYDYSDPSFLDYLRVGNENIAATGSNNLINIWPVLRFIPGDPFKFHRTMNNLKAVEQNFIIPSIEDHKKNSEHYREDFIGRYLRAMHMENKTNNKSSLSEINLLKVADEVFFAGTETTSTTTLWTILYFLHYPQVYQKCYTEVQDVVGSGRLPSVKDKANMPYTEAVIMEVLRIANPVFFNLPHGASYDTVFHGYTIPKGAVIIANLDSILASDDVWGDADVFRPERFLDANGQVVKPEEWLPFSLGRRVCLGEAMAKMVLFLNIATLVQRFDFQAVDPYNLPTLKGECGLVHTPTPYQVKAVPRF